MKRTWQYLVNPFLTATETSFPLAQVISNYHLSALNVAKSDPYFLSLYEVYLPLNEAYEKAFAKWKAKHRQQTGHTLSLNQLLEGLTEKVNDWELAIRAVHKKDTPAFRALLGGGHDPFTKGSQTSRIAAVTSLGENLTGNVVLSNLKADVDEYAGLLSEALHSKDTAKHNTGSLSDDLEIARIAICTQQYIHLGMLIAKFATAPEQIEKYFDTSHIRGSGSGGVEPGIENGRAS